ncbi:cyclic pyranopterin monophosphate synthase subunit MoaA [Tahibacter aquaticus]|uniref:GTP 3',8-cyclase n=1 Tax=Tahibacter aquaticus TaxID=520092 RepID=A0A4R6YP84_9GAMM|nr:GTP 3',8-cyclase MoaA [Tahibacter aquaticus]TDR39352.1 cyclic pyranopterin monophosphate synthase subunit MoaA [Tahibacter aquaticus]
MAASIPLRLEPPQDRYRRGLTDLRISVVDRCNFRCPYCLPEDQYPEHHAFLDKQARLSFEEITRLARIFAGLGVHKIRLTGGEPLLRRDLPVLVRQLARIEGIADIAMTSNGVLLPRFAGDLRAAGLQRITLSLDSLDAGVFRQLSGNRGEVAEVLAAIAAAERAGFGGLKLNCVVLRGVNEAGVLDLVEHFRATPHVLRFIEYMDVGTLNGWQRDRVVPSAELLERIAARWPLSPLRRAHSHDVAERYRFDDGGGEIGFISSVTAPFCGDCSRARLSADGKLYTCLFAGSGFDLRSLLRDGSSDERISAAIADCWSRRDDRYSEQRALQRAGTVEERVEMFAIGG